MSPAERAALVQGAVATIRAEEGPYHCRGRYYAREYDASFWQKLEAEKVVRQAEREKARQECVYCHHPILPGEHTVIFAGDPMHMGCAHSWDCFANGSTDVEIDEMLHGIDAPEPTLAEEAA